MPIITIRDIEDVALNFGVSETLYDSVEAVA